ncbi:unnamed protein product, partial [marine sediment metagenome]
MYTTASDADLALIERMDNLMAEAVRKNNPALSDGFAGWRKEIRAWKMKDRAQTRSYTYGQKTGEIPVDTPSYSDFWRERGKLHEELGELKQRGYRMMEGDQIELAKFSQISPRQTFDDFLEASYPRKTMLIDDINLEFQDLPANAQQQIDEIRVVIEAGEEMPPILVSKDGYLQDGRHRLEAYKQLGIDEIEVKIGSHP